MKRLFLSLLAAALMLGMAITPAAAAPSSSVQAIECGTTYIVQPKDNLTKIAELCNLTLERLLAYNPQITNPNLIYTGQVIKITGARITYSIIYRVLAGDTLAEIAGMFDTTVWAIQQANPGVETDEDLYAGRKLNIPNDSSYTGYVGNARVSLSKTVAKAGDEITVWVRGFPANSWIDYRVGEYNEDYSVVYDGTVGPDGTDSAIIKIPTIARDGEYWVVKVMTTSQKEGVEVTSARIFIDN